MFGTSKCEQLARQSALNDAIIQASGQSLLVVDELGIIQSMSEHTSQMFGYEAADTLTNRKMDFFLQDLDSPLDLNNHNRREARGLHAKGGFIKLEVGVAPIQSTAKQQTSQFAIMIKLETPKKKSRWISLVSSYAPTKSIMGAKASTIQWD